MSRLEDDAVQLALSLELPDHAHVPGFNARHHNELLESVVAMASPITSNNGWRENPAWLYGIRLFNQGFFSEAHEVLERVWMNAQPNSRERHLVQGVVQLANARLKEVAGRTKAAERLFAIAGQCFERTFAGGVESLMGISAGELASQTASPGKTGKRIQLSDCAI